jgi:hypothetical protein
MRSIAKILVTVSLLVGALTCFGGGFLTNAAAQESAEAAILEQQLKLAANKYEQQQKKNARRLQWRLEYKQRLARKFKALIAKARVQHARIEHWQNLRLRQLRAQANRNHGKKRIQVATTYFR